MPVGNAFIHRNRGACPGATGGRPVYAVDERQASAALSRLGTALRDHLVVEDPTRPLAAEAVATGTAKIVEDLPERVVVQTEAATPAYLVLSDTFDPGWSATVDAEPKAIRPAYVAFRAVYLPGGKHTVVFTYRPAGFDLGLGLSGCGILLALVLGFLPPRKAPLAPDHKSLNWPRAGGPGGFLRWERSYWFRPSRSVRAVDRSFRAAGKIASTPTPGGGDPGDEGQSAVSTKITAGARGLLAPPS